MSHEVKFKWNFREHLQTAISYLIPIVCGAGFLISIGNALGGDAGAALNQSGFSVWDMMSVLGAKALGLLPVVISVGIAGSIAGKPGIAPGLIAGLAAIQIDAGFIGGLLGGYIAGYLVDWMVRKINVPQFAKGLMPTLIIPFVSSLILGLIMIYIIGGPISLMTNAITNFLSNLGTTSKLVMGGIIGLLSGIDYGGPLNKTVFAFVLSLQAEGVNEPITALQLVNTAIPIGYMLAEPLGKLFNKRIYTDFEVENARSAGIMGVFNIVEGVIPIVMNDLIKCTIASGVGAFVGGAVSMSLGADATVPFGGVLMLPTMSRPWTGLLAIIASALATAITLVLIKPSLTKEEAIVSLTDSAEDEEEIDDIEITIM